MNVSNAEAKMELALIDSKANEIDRADFFSRLTNADLPPEVLFRLEELWGATKVIGEKVVHTGKIIIFEIIRFIEENPHLAIGVALGVAIGALVNLIPFLGSLLAPIATAIGVVVGGFAGARLDRDLKVENGAIGIAQELIILAKKFFEFFAAIFIALKADFTDEV
ncbi:MAG: hypothetical protein Q8K07_18370 [Methylicorpusculum sp.]|uniref:hypothetical protein n=1 Tax=Methylicorpusculum sp. TaxID=2713644 RepID=UPI002730AC71|nr:hypothetical protein [Methylicorpusculum sp.]MDP2203988.1 hypothetical protein [Methylicorpusculum sp.]